MLHSVRAYGSEIFAKKLISELLNAAESIILGVLRNLRMSSGSFWEHSRYLVFSLGVSFTLLALA